MPRDRLLNRRRAVLLTIDRAGSTYELGLGVYADGKPGEMFIAGARSGSDVAAQLADAALLISRVLQHGDDLADLARAMGREGNGMTPSSVIGATLDVAARR